ncbi:DUF4352 domain-containing protein, partial [Arthrobacter mobilis]
GNPARDAKAQAKADKAYKKASRPWFKKKRFILPLALVAIIAIASVAGGGGGSDQDTAANNSSTENQAPAAAQNEAAEKPAEEPKAKAAFPGAKDSDVVGEAGDKLKLGEITVTSAPITEGDATLGATLCTAVTVANGSDETIDFNAMDWKLQSPGGTIANTSFSGSDNMISAGQIAPGGSTKGDVCFDAKDAEEGQYVVLYEPVFSFFSDRGAWINK